MVGDRVTVDRNAERARDIESIVGLRQLPQATEQTLGRTTREHDALTVRHP